MILCCGEALIDMLPRETTQGEPAFAPHTGGAVFNTAVALGRLGAPSGFFSGLSTDLFGQMLDADLTAAHVDASFAHRSGRPTTLAFVTLKDGQASYAFYDENSAGATLAEADIPDLDDSVEALFFGCISLVGEPCGTTYEALAQREAERRLIMCDPNIRAGFIQDEAAYRARLDRMIAISDIVKLSDEDLTWLRGPGDIAAQAEALLAEGPALVCITQGSEGVAAFSRSGPFHIPASPVEVVDTVGAGDTFNAGLLASLHTAGAIGKSAFHSASLETLKAAVAQGARAAAITVSRAGANPPWAHEL